MWVCSASIAWLESDLMCHKCLVSQTQMNMIDGDIAHI